jgi:hypothetical protein
MYKRRSFTLEPALLAWLDAKATEHDQSSSGALRQVVKEAMRREQEQERAKQTAT